MPKLQFLNVANMSFNTFHENKILAKISEFTVYTLVPYMCIVIITFSALYCKYIIFMPYL